jgi:hypothetical protein
MRRRTAVLLLLALASVGALASRGAEASRPTAPEVVSVQTGPFGAVVRWRVPESARVVVEVGPDDRYGIWSTTTLGQANAVGKTTLAGLEPATTYRFRVTARLRTGLKTEDRGHFRTDPWPGALSASAKPVLGEPGTGGADLSPFVLPQTPPPGASGSTPTKTTPSIPAGTPKTETSAPLRVNGAAVFPRMVWRQCPTYYPTSLGAGINTFLGVSCDNEGEQLSRLAGRALSTVDAATPGITGPGVVGWHLPDEADVSVGDVAKLPSPKAEGRVTFLTLTDKFSAGAAPGPYGKTIYPGFFERADVIGFDTYPVEVRCSHEQIDNVYWMQRELISLTGGKPTFQWIEAGPMEHCRWNEDPSPAVVRAETWLAIAGGARGIGYFPDYWQEDIRSEVRVVNRDILALAPALLSPATRVTWSPDKSPVRLAGRRYNGATYIIAANSSTQPATVSFSVPGLAGRKLRVFRDGRTVTPMGDLVLDKLPGLGTAVYVVPPAGW